MPRRAFLPPALCGRCVRPPELGETLTFTVDWVCAACLIETTRGGDLSTKAAILESMSARQRVQSRRTRSAGRSSEADLLESEAAWSAHNSRLIRAHGQRSARQAQVIGGEALPDEGGPLRDTLLEPGLISVDASAKRGGLLARNDVLALGLDVANSANAANTPEKLLAHQVALAHKVAFEQTAQADKEKDPAIEIKRLNTAARMMSVAQDGLLALQRIRTGGKQTVVVQHVYVEAGAQAVIGSIDTAARDGTGSNVPIPGDRIERNSADRAR